MSSRTNIEWNEMVRNKEEPWRSTRYFQSHPGIHPRDPYNPWWCRVMWGFGSLVDGVIAICTLGKVVSGYGSDAAFATLRWGLVKMEKEKMDDEKEVR